MPPILNDPNLAKCPSFQGQFWVFLRQSVIDTHQGPQPLSNEEAILRMKEAWTLENDSEIAAWNAQLELNRAEQEEQDRLANEEKEAWQAQRDREAEKQLKEAERKKPKISAFSPNHQISNWVEARPSAYALNKINTLKYVELDYFTVRGCKEAAADLNKSISHNTFGFTNLDGTFAISPLPAQKASKNVRSNEHLSWEEMFDAKNTMLHFMAQSKVWPAPHLQSLAAFFVAIELHPRRQLANGKKALIIYQSVARFEWLSALKRGDGFNIELINEELLRTHTDLANDRVRNEEIEQVCSLHLFSKLSLISLFPPPPLTPPRSPRFLPANAIAFPAC